MDIDKEGATLKKRDGSKFLEKRSTQVGGASFALRALFGLGAINRGGARAWASC